MIDQQGPPGDGGAPRKRPGPTIDLQATEIRPTGPEGNAAAAAGADRVEAESSTAAATGPQDNAQQRSGFSSFAGRWASSWPAGWSRRLASFQSPAWPLIAAATAGAAFVLFAVLVVLSMSNSGGGVSVLETRLSTLEQQVAELARRPANAGMDAKTIDALTDRLGALETAARTQRPLSVDPALANRMATLEGSLKALDEKIGVVARRTDDIDTTARDAQQRAAALATSVDQLGSKVAALPAEAGSPAALDALSKRVAALEETVTQLDKRAPGDRAARMSAAAAAMANAVDRGEGFSAELSALQALGAEPKAISVLEPYAASGVPSAAALGRELAVLIPILSKAAGAPAASGSFLERLAAHAEKLIRIRRVDDLTGDDAATVLARLEIRAEQSDIAGATSDIAKLPPEMRAQAQAWVTKAEARTNAVAASRRLVAEAAAALAKSP